MFPLSALLGLGQVAAGALLPKGRRPMWQIPGAASEELSMARREAMATTRPGAADAKATIRNSAAETLNKVQKTADSGQGVLAAAIALNNNTNKALIQDNIQNDQFRFNAKRNLAATLGRYAGYQREKFIKDTIEPYQERAAVKNQLVSSGLTNVFSGINSSINQNQQQQYLDYLTGGGSDNSYATSQGGGFNFGKLFNIFGRHGGSGYSGGYSNGGPPSMNRY